MKTGAVCRKRKPYTSDDIFILSGSFSRTGRGHGTDRAIVGGIMGFETDDIRIRDALDIAKKAGIEINFIHQDIPNTHPNTARITYYLPDGSSS